ncbi:MAG: TIR domain-containing protein, partial [Bacteroidetes bacterium]|nr:TIR domain-containing protein [Bacteroidota bacterium]
MSDKTPTSPLKVFISYSHGDQEHDDWVAQFANQLRNAGGVDANIDQFVNGAFPDEDWDTWMFQQIREADFVLCICTETYRRRAEGDEDPGKGLGVKWESTINRKRIYERLEEDNHKKFVAILPPGGKKEDVPYFLPIHHFQMLDDWDGLFRLFQDLPLVKAEDVNPKPYKPEVKTTSTLPTHPPTTALDIGRSSEIAQLDEFWNSPDKRIFTFYGVAQMGKSYTIGHWKNTYLKNEETIQILLSEGILATARAGKELFGSEELPEPHRLIQKIEERFKKKTLVWFANTETALELKPGRDSHPFSEPRLLELVQALSNHRNVKIVLECRYFIDLPGTVLVRTGLKENQLQKINAAYFWPYYESEFTRHEYELIYEKTGGNTWLLINIPDTFQDLFFDKAALLEDIQATTKIEEYRDKYLRLLLDQLNAPETKLICQLIFIYKPQKLDFFATDLPEHQRKAGLNSLNKKLLIIVDPDNQISINGYVREICRLHFKDYPDMQEAMWEQEKRVGKKYRSEDTPHHRVDRYQFLVQENQWFTPYYIELAKAYKALRETAKGEKVLLDAIAYGQSDRDQLFLYSELISNGDYPTALKWFEEMKRKGVKPNEISYNTLVNKSGDYPTALKWFEEMKREGVKPTEISYSTLVNKSGDYPTALKWFEEMKRKGVKPNEISYNTL